MRFWALIVLWIAASPIRTDAYIVIKVDVEAGANEAAWSDALAVGLEGATREWRVDGGVADIATDTHIYEVDRLAKWHEGVGQVLHYRDESGKQGVRVLILPDGYSDWVRLEKLERKHCKPYGIKLIVLMRVQPPLTAGIKTQGREATSQSSS